MEKTRNVLTIGNLHIERDRHVSLKLIKIVGKIEAKIECFCSVTGNLFQTVDLVYKSSSSNSTVEIIDDLVHKMETADIYSGTRWIHDVDVKSKFSREIELVDLQLGADDKAKFETIFTNRSWVLNKRFEPQLSEK